MNTGTESNRQKSSLLERIGMGFLAGILIELAFWIFLGLLTLAFTGGVWSVVTALALGTGLAIVLWDIQSSKNMTE